MAACNHYPSFFVVPEKKKKCLQQDRYVTHCWLYQVKLPHPPLNWLTWTQCQTVWQHTAWRDSTGPYIETSSSDVSQRLFQGNISVLFPLQSSVHINRVHLTLFKKTDIEYELLIVVWNPKLLIINHIFLKYSWIVSKNVNAICYFCNMQE